jgi:hypothetical protein
VKDPMIRSQRLRLMAEPVPLPKVN